MADNTDKLSIKLYRLGGTAKEAITIPPHIIDQLKNAPYCETTQLYLLGADKGSQVQMIHPLQVPSDRAFDHGYDIANGCPHVPPISSTSLAKAVVEMGQHGYTIIGFAMVSGSEWDLEAQMGDENLAHAIRHGAQGLTQELPTIMLFRRKKRAFTFKPNTHLDDLYDYYESTGVSQFNEVPYGTQRA